MLVLLDGSPRGPRSNTHLLLEAFAAGYRRAGGGPVTSHYVSKRKRWPEIFAALAQADIVILAMPLYVHAMPATVKELIEALPTFERSRATRVGFIVQSGFPEPAQSAWLARYLERLPARLQALHIGTAIRGGVEGIQAIPPLFRRQTLTAFEQLGADLALSGSFPTERLAAIAGNARMGFGRRLLFRAINAIGWGPDGYFGRQLKAAGAYDERHARPYLRAAPGASEERVRA